MTPDKGKRTFKDILELIHDQKLGLPITEGAQVIDKAIDKKEYYKEAEKTIKSNIEILKRENDPFRNAYFNLISAENYPMQELFEEDFIKLIYVNQLPDKARQFMGRILNIHRVKNGKLPLITKVIKRDGEEVFLVDEGKFTVEEMFNQQFISRIEDLYKKTIAILTNRPADLLTDDVPAKSLCNVKRAYQEMMNTVLLADAFGFNSENILATSDIPDLYLFALKGISYNRLHTPKK